MDCRRKAKQYV
jgi:hypothetical protein